MKPGALIASDLPLDCDEDEHIEIIIAVTTEWSGKAEDENDIEDRAANIADALNARRCSLLEDNDPQISNGR
jgi:hypothetical protein